MLVRIKCACGHAGAVDSASLPREVTCWQCGRHVVVEAGTPIRAAPELTAAEQSAVWRAYERYGRPPRKHEPRAREIAQRHFKAVATGE